VPILIQVELLFFGRFAAFGGGDDVLMSRWLNRHPCWPQNVNSLDPRIPRGPNFCVCLALTN
jgi:hypothetical protein